MTCAAFVAMLESASSTSRLIGILDLDPHRRTPPDHQELALEAAAAALSPASRPRSCPGPTIREPRLDRVAIRARIADRERNVRATELSLTRLVTRRGSPSAPRSQPRRPSNPSRVFVGSPSSAVTLTVIRHRPIRERAIEAVRGRRIGLRRVRATGLRDRRRVGARIESPCTYRSSSDPRPPTSSPVSTTVGATFATSRRRRPSRRAVRSPSSAVT